ncbi:MAG: hypothetical protein IT235_08045 [Bacteroidia bacterium]|nr:hypothetical protein [Bacteroidia bacterium]
MSYILFNTMKTSIKKITLLLFLLATVAFAVSSCHVQERGWHGSGAAHRPKR